MQTIIISFLKKHWRVSLIIVLAWLAIYFYSSSRQHRDDAIRWEGNYDAMQMFTEKRSMILELTKGELKRSKNDLKEALLQVDGVKAKDIRFIHKIRTVTKMDTVVVLKRDTTINMDTVYVVKNSMEYADDCHKAWVYFFEGDSTAHYSYETEVNLSIVGFKERSKRFKLLGLRLFKYGRWNHFVDVASGCESTDIAYNKYIEINKKK